MIKETLEGHGIKLHRLTEDKIEMVRCWRNDPKISKYMVYREHITEQQQREWFKKVNNDKNLYYLIEVNDKPVGLVNIKDISDKSGEIGIFIYDDSLLHANVSKKAYKILISYAFNELNLDCLVAHVLADNPRSTFFHVNWGFRQSHTNGDSFNHLYSLTKENYENSKYYPQITQ